MKKVLLFAGVLFIFGATSCKKDYTCSCELAGTTTDSVIENSTKKQPTTNKKNKQETRQ